MTGLGKDWVLLLFCIYGRLKLYPLQWMEKTVKGGLEKNIGVPDAHIWIITGIIFNWITANTMALNFASSSNSADGGWKSDCATFNDILLETSVEDEWISSSWRFSYENTLLTVTFEQEAYKLHQTRTNGVGRFAK